MGILLYHNLRIGDFDIRQHLDGCLGCLLLGHVAVNDKGLRKLPLHREHRVQGGHGLLENDGNLIAADMIHLAHGNLREILSIKDDLTGVHIAIAIQQPQNTHGGDGFAGTGLTHHTQSLARLDGIGNTIDRLHNAAAGLKIGVEIFRFK